MRKTFLFILALCAASAVWGTTTVTKTYKIADIASNNDWTDNTAYTSFDLGEEFHIKAVGSTNGVYYTANNGIWRSYQGREKGEFTISAKAGYIITKIKVTYPATKNNGVLSKNPKPEGAASPASDQMKTGVAYNFNASLVTLYVGNTDATNENSGQVSISQFEITYEKGIVETFDKLSDETKASTDDRKGDWFTWKITTGARHKTTDVLYNGTRSLWLSGNGGASMETKTTIEGGVKYVSFLWNKFNKEASLVKVSVTAGDVTRELEKTVQTGEAYNQNHPDLVFGDNFGVKSNTKLKIANPQTTTALQIGPITIVPYIFYTQKSATLNVTKDTPTTTFTNDQLIDNRDDEEPIVYSIVEDNGVATINAETGEVTGLKPGTVTVQAAYGEATTTYQLTITGDGQLDPELTFEKETVWCKLGDSFTNTLTHKGDGTVTYTSNRTDRATIDATGKVTTILYGQVIITASIEASGFYKATEKTYVVNIQPTETPVYELFSTVTQESASPSATWDGDTGEKWTAKYARRKSPEDEINGHLATRLGATASIVSNTRLQGGIKYISFIVRQQDAGDVAADDYGVRIQRRYSDGSYITNNRFHFPANENLPVIYVVDNYGSDKPSVYADAYKLYFANESKKNDKIVTTSGAAPILIDSIAFYPYIYFKKGRTVSMKDQGSYDNMKCNVAEAEYLLNNITAADGGTVSYSIVGENYGASINSTTGEVDYSEVTEDADIKIQAKYYEAITSQILHVNALKAPVITVTGVTSGSMAKTFKDGSFTLNYTLKVGGETRTDIPLEWTSSDPSIASIDNDGNITIYMAGSVTITASNEEDIAGNLRASSYSFTLNIAGIGENESLIERFTDITASAWTHSATSFTSTAYGTDWKVNHFTTKYNDEVLGQKAVRLSKDNGGGEINSNGAIEGGIKAVAFDWWLAGSTDQNVQFGITAGSTSKTIKYDAIPSGSSNTTHYEQFFGENSNCNFQFLMNDYTQNSFILGPITITPYIFYTVKDTAIDRTKVATFTNDKLIDNRDDEVAIVYSIVGDNDGVATIDATTGVVTCLKAGTITVQAAYGEAKTTYTLTIKGEVDAHFATEGKVEKVLADGSFTNAVVVTAGDATPAYESDNTNVAEVDAEGKVTIKAIGTATITATMAETAKFLAWEDSYTVVVRTGVAADNKLVEHFTQMPKGLISTEGGEEVEGDINITWLAYSTRRGANDTIGGVGIQGNNIFTKGYIKSQTAVEGGIKYFSLNWKQWANESNCTLKLRAKLGESEFSMEQAGTGPATYEHYFFAINAGIKSNVGIALYNESYNEDGPLASNGRITFDAFEIVPYLFYKTKSHTIENATEGATYTNTDLINNIDEGTITYSLISEGADEIAEIDAATGEVTVKAGGVVTVQAKWVADATKQDEFVTTTYELTINFPQPTITFNNIEVALDGTVTPDITVKLDEEDITETATITYEVADENIATWDATDGWKLKTNGTTQVTAKVERTAQYGAASATATMTVNTMTFAEGTFFTENFGGEATSGYSTKTENWRGKDNVYPWTYLNWIRYADHVRITMTKPGSSNINGYIYMNPFDGGALEGGIKAVQVTWSAPGASSLATDFYVDDMKNSDATKVTIQKKAGTISGQQITQAIFNSKTDKAQLRIRIGSLDKSAIDVYSVDIVPYLLYTKKEVSVTYDLEGTNTVDVTENLINNLEEGETVTYSLSAGAQATIDGSTITLANATENVVVTAKWTEGDNTITTTFTLKVTKAEDPEPEPDFVLENKTAGALATVCLPNKIDRIENGTLYSISYGDKTSIEFVEADYANDDAGMPYLVQVTADGNVNFYYGEGDAVTEPVDVETAKGFVGSLQEEPQEIPSDGTAILVSGGQLRVAGTNCVLTKNHAYIDATKLPTEPELVPGGAPRKTIRLYNPEAQVPTNLNGLNGAVKPMKVLRDGQLYILRDTKTYNALGILVE